MIARTQRADITIEAWERAARRSSFAAAIHPSGISGTDDPAWAASGLEHAVAWHDGLIRHSPDLPARILDFGCGAGRVTFPLSRLFPASTIFAADASSTMLDRLEDSGSLNEGIEPWLSDGFDGQLPEQVDAVHSIIVLQHYPWAEGEALLALLLAALRPGKLAGIQLPLYEIEGQSRDWTGVTSWTFRRLDKAARAAGAQVLECHMSPSLFRPGAVGPHHGAYHWLRKNDPRHGRWLAAG